MARRCWYPVLEAARWHGPAFTGPSSPVPCPRVHTCDLPPPVHTEAAQSARHLEAEAFQNLTSQTKSRSAAAPVTRTPTFATLRRRVLAALDELKAHDIREIDVQGRTSIADLLIIASGTSSRHVKSIADEVVKFAKRAGMLPLGVEGQSEAEWVLVDLGDIIVHVMLPRIREFYGLERLWTVGDQAPDAEAANA